jgi:Protein of unknown function (DUF2934)
MEAMPAPAIEPAVSTPESVTTLVPSFEDVASLAYSYWEARGCQGGSPDEDWLRAEQELRTRAVAATA